MVLTLTVLALGAAVLGVGLARLWIRLPACFQASRTGRDAVLTLIPAASALRAVLGGLALVFLGFGRLYGLSWMVAFAMVFGLEELYETSAVLGILRWSRRMRRSTGSLLVPVSYPRMSPAIRATAA